MHRTCAPVDKGTSICRIFEDLQDRSHRRPLPHEIAEAVASWKEEVVAVQKLQHFTRRALLHKGREDEMEAILHFAMGIFLDAPGDIADEANR